MGLNSGEFMDKKKKRAISRGKFVRVMDMVLNTPWGHPDTFSYYSPNKWINSYVYGDFMYWQDRDYDKGDVVIRYFRKSVMEALS